MKLIADNRVYENPTDLGLGGGEGDIYQLAQDLAAKIYAPDLRALRREKVLALCTATANHEQRLAGIQIALPQAPAYMDRRSQGTFSGFTMAWFSNCSQLVEIGFDLADGCYREANGKTLGEENAIDLVYELFTVLDRLHQAHVVLGDVSPCNLLYHWKSCSPVVIDVDSAQIGSFGCPVVTEDYADPAVLSRGTKGDGSFSFDSGTDVYGLAVVTFELLVGALPHFLVVDPVTSQAELRSLGLTSLSSEAELRAAGLARVNCPRNDAVLSRIEQIRQRDGRLLEFYRSVFCEGKRLNPCLLLPIDSARNPGQKLFASILRHSPRAPQRGYQAVIDRLRGDTTQAGFRQVIDSLGKRDPTAAAPSAPQSADTRQGFRAVIDQMTSSSSPVTDSLSSSPPGPTAKTRGGQAGSTSGSDEDLVLRFLRGFALDL